MAHNQVEHVQADGQQRLPQWQVWPERKENDQGNKNAENLVIIPGGQVTVVAPNRVPKPASTASPLMPHTVLFIATLP